MGNATNYNKNSYSRLAESWLIRRSFRANSAIRSTRYAWPPMMSSHSELRLPIRLPKEVRLNVLPMLYPSMGMRALSVYFGVGISTIHREITNDLKLPTRGRGQRIRSKGKLLINCDECGAEIERPAGKVRSTHNFCDHKCEFENADRRRAGKEAQERRAAPLRERLMADAGPCGSPQCQDAECRVTPGACHLPGCVTPASIASATHRTWRRVAGAPMLYCSHEHRSFHSARILNQALENARAEFVQLRKSGKYLDTAQAAKMLGRSRSTVLYHAEKLSVGRRTEPSAWGPRGALLLSVSDLRRIRESMETSSSGATFMDPSRHANWHLARHGNYDVFGRRAADLAVAGGKRVGPRPAVEPGNAEEREILQRHRQEQSQRFIAEAMSISRKSVRGVLKRNGLAA